MPATLTESEIAELGVSYAALILHDDNVPITADKLNALLKASNVKASPYWVNLYAKVLASKNIDDFLMSGGGAAPVAAPAAVNPKEDKKGGAPPKVEKEEKKKKEEEKPESDEDMGLALFD